MNRRRALTLGGTAAAGALLAAGVAGCSSTESIPFQVLNGSIVLPVTLNGVTVQCILDTGDAIGPVLTVADAQRCNVQPTGVIEISGAGGVSDVYTCDVTVGVGTATFTNESGAIDPDLSDSLLGLPFFLARAKSMTFDFTNHKLSADWK